MDASLANLSIGNLVLNPAFDPAVNNYTAKAVYRTDDVDVTMDTNDAAASFTINGGANTNVALALGDTTIDIEVTAEDGATTRNYEVVVTRANFGQQAYVKASNTQANDHCQGALRPRPSLYL